VRSTAAPYTESRLTRSVANECVGFPVVEQHIYAVICENMYGEVMQDGSGNQESSANKQRHMCACLKSNNIHSTKANFMNVQFH
jgi:hypothetical protein